MLIRIRFLIGNALLRYITLILTPTLTGTFLCCTRRLQFLPKIVPFRTAWYYSNTMLVFVSRLCEVKTGRRWAEVVAESFWQPLQMNSTVMAPHALSLDNVARPYILRMRADDMFVEQDARLFEYVNHCSVLRLLTAR